jgi:AcrR family transcriptional regulator
MAPSRAQRRVQVLEELLVLIEGMLDAGEPFSDISVERLASTAGMSRTRFYLYFEDKNDLLLAWFGRIREGLAAEGGRWWGDEPPATRDVLVGLVGRMLRAYRPHATLMAAVEEVAAASLVVRAEVDAAMNADADALREHIARARPRGSADPGLDTDAVARWLTVMTWRGRSHLLRGADDAEIVRVADGYAGLIWNVLYAGRPAVSSCGSSPSR